MATQVRRSGYPARKIIHYTSRCSHMGTRERTGDRSGRTAHGHQELKRLTVADLLKRYEQELHRGAAYTQVPSVFPEP